MTVRTASLILLKRGVPGGRILLVLAGIIAFPSVARADDCSFTSPTDCYNQMMVAVLVIAALVLLIAIGLELFAAAAAIDAAAAGLGAIVTVEGAEGLEASEALAEAEEITAEGEEVTAEADEATSEGTSPADEASKIQSWRDRIAELNWWEGTNNCYQLAVALARSIATGEAPAFLEGMATAGTELSEAADVFGTSVNPSNFVDIARTLLAAGPGSQGIVAVGEYQVIDGALQFFGHAFNVVNDAGTIIFMDSQIVTVATDGAAVAAAAGYQGMGVWFVPILEAF